MEHVSRAPIGAEVKLTYDAPDRDVAAGDGIRTPSGRSYLVIASRRQERGKHAGRWHLRCIVVDGIPAGVAIHPLFWHSRDARTP